MASRAILPILIALAVTGSAERALCGEVRKAPLVLYALGGAADIVSTRFPPQGMAYVDRSPAGPVVGPVLSSLAFAGADSLLQFKGKRGWAKVLRVGYVVGVVGVVVHNRGYNALHHR